MLSGGWTPERDWQRMGKDIGAMTAVDAVVVGAGTDGFTAATPSGPGVHGMGGHAARLALRCLFSVCTKEA